MSRSKENSHLKMSYDNLENSYLKLKVEHRQCGETIKMLREVTNKSHLDNDTYMKYDSRLSSEHADFLIQENERLRQKITQSVKSSPSTYCDAAVETCSEDLSNSFESCTAQSCCSTDIGLQTEEKFNDTLSQQSNDDIFASITHKFTTSMSSLVEELQNSRAKEEELKTRITELDQRVMFLRDEKKEIQRRCDKYFDEKMEKLEQFRELNEANKNLVTEVEALKEEKKQSAIWLEEIAKLQSANNDLAEKVKTEQLISSKLKNIDADNKNLKLRVRELQKSVSQLEQDSKDVDIKLSHAVANCEKLQKELSVARPKLAALQSEKTELAAKLKTVEEAALADKRKCSDLERANAKARETIIDLQGKQEDLLQKYADEHGHFSEKCDEDLVELNKLRSLVKQLEDRNKVHQRREREQNEELVRRVQENSALETQVIKLKEELKVTASALNASDKRVMEIESSAYRSKRLYEETESEHKKEKFRLEQTVLQHVKLIDYLRPFEKQASHCKCKARKMVLNAP